MKKFIFTVLVLLMMLISTVNAEALPATLGKTNENSINPKEQQGNFNFYDVIETDGSGSLKVSNDKFFSFPTLFTGNNVIVDKNVDAATFIMGTDIFVNSKISGFSTISGGNITINGSIESGIIFASNVTINGTIDKDVIIFAKEVTVTQKAVVNRDATIVATNIKIDGRIARNLIVAGQNLDISGIIGAELRAKINNITLQNNSKILGNLYYLSSNDVVIKGNAKIMGTLIREKSNPKGSYTITNGAKMITHLFSAFSLFLVYLVIILIRPSFFENIYNKLKTYNSENYIRIALIGLGVLALTPFASLILFITIIGIPLGLIMMVMYFLLIYSSFIIAGTILGKLIQEKLKVNESRFNKILFSFIGIILMNLILLIPFIGGLLRIAIIICGMGLLVNTVRGK